MKLKILNEAFRRDLVLKSSRKLKESTNMPGFSEFIEAGYYTDAGAEDLPNGSKPLICEGETYDIIISGSPYDSEAYLVGMVGEDFAAESEEIFSLEYAKPLCNKLIRYKDSDIVDLFKLARKLGMEILP